MSIILQGDLIKLMDRDDCLDNFHVAICKIFVKI